MALNKNNRLKKLSDFQGVFKKGKAIGANFLFIKIKRNNLSVNRFGLTVSAKIIKTAVGRNKVKRALSETIRFDLSLMKGGYDVVIGLRRPGSIPELKEDLLKSLKKSEII